MIESQINKYMLMVNIYYSNIIPVIIFFHLR